MKETNGILSEVIHKFASTKEGKSISIGYVDTNNEGELLKETYDIEVVPSIRLVEGDKVYAAKWVEGLWTVEDLQNFVNGGYLSTANYDKRERITPLFLHFEYVLNALSVNHFTEVMENYLWLKKVVFEWTGYKHDLKSVNSLFGKKNAFKKSQIRTLLFHVILPLSLIGTALVLLILICSCFCLQRIFCSEKAAKKQVKEAEEANAKKKN